LVNARSEKVTEGVIMPPPTKKAPTKKSAPAARKRTSKEKVNVDRLLKRIQFNEKRILALEELTEVPPPTGTPPFP
jgi:hypothetical protein